MNNQATSKKPRILILGSTGRTGKSVIAELEPRSDSLVYSSRNRAQVDAWRQAGKEAVFLDLNDARTFPAALTGIDRLFLATGYTVDMVHQSKTIVDAAADAGLQFIVHLGVFGNGRTTDPHFAWHEMDVRYIEGTDVASILELVRQTYDGRMDFAATTTTTVEDLTGRKPLTLREWVVRYRDSVLAVGAQAAKGALKE